LKAKWPGFENWTLACQFSKNYIDWILASPIVQSGNGLAFPKANAGPFFFKGKESLTMDRILSKWIGYAVIGLAVVYLWMHSNSIAPELRALIGDWWK
jgi:hypothetical protein